jgi:biopolymer transport protein ExbD
MERDGSIWINDQEVAMEEVSDVVLPLYAASERHLVISIRGDRETPYVFLDQLQTELVSAGVVRVVFATALERQMGGARR